MKKYTEEEHTTWSTLFARQSALIQKFIPPSFFAGLGALDIRPDKVPQMEIVSKNLKRISGWSLVSAENKYLSAKEWFRHLAVKHFPVTDYIRKPHEIEFTPLPDLFHEYFGHLSFFTDKRFCRLAHEFGRIASRANEEGLKEIQRLWWFSVEFGFLENKKHILGAGLISSPGEFRHATRGTIPKRAFVLDEVVKSPLAVSTFHDRYFIIKDIGELEKDILTFLRTSE